MRLVDLVAGMSRLADLGFGLPPGESLRSSALTLARPPDLPDEDVRAGLYSGLMLHAGCVGFAHETAQLYGDEFTVQMAAERANRADARDVATTLVPRLLRGRPAGEKARSAGAHRPRGGGAATGRGGLQQPADPGAKPNRSQPNRSSCSMRSEYRRPAERGPAPVLQPRRAVGKDDHEQEAGSTCRSGTAPSRCIWAGVRRCSGQSGRRRREPWPIAAPLRRGDDGPRT